MSKKNQRLLIILLIAIFGAFTTGSAVQKESPAKDSKPAEISSTRWYAVKKVVDGDTIDVQVGSSTVRVRLIGLDTPETVDPRQPVQCFGKEATAKMKEIFDDQSVRLETDPSQGPYDRYGRLLAYVYVPDESHRPEGALVNLYMIEEGFGHEYTYDIPYKYQAEFKEAQRHARENLRGLWAPGVCTSSS